MCLSFLLFPFRLLFSSSLLLFSPRVSAHVVLPPTLSLFGLSGRDDAYVPGRISLVSAFCRDRRGYLGGSEMESSARR